MSCSTMKKAKVENALSKADRDALVVGGPVSFADAPAAGVVGLCKKEARGHARRVLADRGRRFDPEELEGEALAAAVEAARYFDPAAGTKFTSYVGKWIDTALKQATDERRQPDVRAGGGSERFGRRADDRDDADDDPEARYGEYTAADLDADQKAAFDLLGPAAKRVVGLLIAGHDLTAIGLQLDMPGKDVRLAMRGAIDVLRKVGLVPPDADPYPAEAARQAAASEAARPRNVAAVRERERKDAKRADRAAVPGLVRDALAADPTLTNGEIARRLGVGDGPVGKAVKAHGLRPARATAPAAG